MDIAVNIAAIMTPVVLALGFFLAYRQWKATSNARVAQVILDLTARWDTPELQRSRQKINECSKRLKECVEEADAENSQNLYELVAVGNFFDTIGVLVMKGSLSCGTAYNLFGEPEEFYYGVYKPLLEDVKHKKYYHYFIQLHEAFRKEQAGRYKVVPRSVA